MRFKVQYKGKKKYVKLNGAPHSEFLKEAKMKLSIPTEKDIYLLDDTGTEVNEEVFSDILEEKTDILWTIVDTFSHWSISLMPIAMRATFSGSLKTHSENSAVAVKFGEGALKPQTAADQSWSWSWRGK